MKIAKLNTTKKTKNLFFLIVTIGAISTALLLMKSEFNEVTM